MKQLGKYTIFFDHRGHLTGIKINGKAIPRFLVPELCSNQAEREFNDLSEGELDAKLLETCSYYEGQINNFKLSVLNVR